MKRLFWLVAMLAICLAAVAQTQYRSGNFIFKLYEPTNGDSPYAVVSGVVSYPGTEVTIPGTVEKNGVSYTVTEIGSFLFDGFNCKLNKLTIPPTIKIFNRSAFSYMERCDEVHISDLSAWAQADFKNISANPIRYMLYLNGEPLNNVEFSTDVTKISNYAFYYCASIQSVSIPSSVTSIGETLFEGCTNLETLTISEGLKEIGKLAFYNCSKLNDVSFPSSLASVGAYSFSNSGLKSVVFSSTDEPLNLEKAVFFNCRKLSSVRLPDNITTLPDMLLGNCYSLKSLTIPPSIKTVRNNPLLDSNNLVRLDISDLSAWCRIDFINHSMPRDRYNLT